MHKQQKRIAVIGGGWAGVYALKYFLETGHDAVLYERTGDIGGTFNYRPHLPGGCFRNTRTTSSKIYLHASDYPMPTGTPHFPHHTQCIAFLNDYCTHFKLWDHMQFHRIVVDVKKMRNEEGEKSWRLIVKRLRPSIDERGEDTDNEENKVQDLCDDVWREFEEGEDVEFFDCVSNCTGIVGVPHLPIDQPEFVGYTGKVTHSHYFKFPTSEMKGKSCMIVGGGESASDVAYEVSHWSKPGETYMSLRTGHWLHDRTVGGYQPADCVWTKHQRNWGFSNYQSWMVWLGRYLMIEFMWGKGGSGIKEWQPEVEYFHGFLNKSRDVVDRVVAGKVKARRGVRKCEGKKVWFHGEDEPAEIDVIIFCTGYRHNADIMEDKENMLPQNAYKFVFWPDDPTLSWIGNVRPFIGGVMSLAEMQARFVSEVYAGRCTLPSTAEMKEIIRKDTERHARVFPADHRNLPTLVNHWEYTDELAEFIGAKPKQLQWLLRSPRRWFKIVSAPWNAHLYRVEDPKTREMAFKYIDEVYADNSYHFPFNGFNQVMLILDLILIFMGLLLIYYVVRTVTTGLF